MEIDGTKHKRKSTVVYKFCADCEYVRYIFQALLCQSFNYVDVFL